MRTLEGQYIAPASKRGFIVRYRDPKGNWTVADYLNEEELLPPIDNKPMASVGLSLTIGQSADFGKEKIEVSAWCTMPCEPTQESIEDTYSEVYELVETTVGERANQAFEAFFGSGEEK